MEQEKIQEQEEKLKRGRQHGKIKNEQGKKKKGARDKKLKGTGSKGETVKGARSIHDPPNRGSLELRDEASESNPILKNQKIQPNARKCC